MAKLFNLARMTTATPGTGTITLGSAVSGYLTFALAGVQDGDTVSYGIKDGSNSEVGTGVYTATGTTLTRVVTKSTNSNAAINLSGAAEVFITARAEDIFNTADPLTSAQVAVQSDMESASSNTLAVTPGMAKYHPGVAKAWARFGTSAMTLGQSYNVSSITDNGAGDFTVNFSTAFSSATAYAGVGTGGNGATGGTVAPMTGPTGANPTASAWRGIVTNTAGSPIDVGFINVAFFGDQ